MYYMSLGCANLNVGGLRIRIGHIENGYNYRTRMIFYIYIMHGHDFLLSLLVGNLVT